MPGIPGIPDAHGTPKVADAPGTADASAAAGARDPAAVVPPAFVVALPTFNDARTIGGVVAAARGGLARSFAASDVRLVLADAGSNDGTREQAREAARPARLLEVECPPAPAREFPYHGHPGRASALRAVLQAAQQLGAGGCAVVDTRLEAPHAETVEQLIAPILADTADYVSPFYTRRVNEGAITKGIVYPVFRALYGVRLRQPAAGEFGCSTRFAAHCLDQDFWEAEHAQAGIDLWLATAAATGGFRVSEAALGERRAAPLEVPVDLSTTLAQVVGALFADLETRVDLWQRTRRSTPVSVAGGPVESVGPLAMEPAEPAVEGLIESFRLGYRELREIWTWVLPPRTIVDLRKLTEVTPDRFRLDDRLWATIVYDFALGYSLRVMAHDHLLRSLTPLYSGWLASFVLEMAGAGRGEVDARIERLCEAFEVEKRYLIARWRWPERLRS